MRLEPKLTAEAWADVRKAIVHYSLQHFDLGSEFLNEVERIVAHIQEAPLLSTLVDAPIRRALLHRFPFGVFYVAGDADVPDVIVAVMDLRQDPEVIRRAYSR